MSSSQLRKTFSIRKGSLAGATFICGLFFSYIANDIGVGPARLNSLIGGLALAGSAGLAAMILTTRYLNDRWTYWGFGIVLFVFALRLYTALKSDAFVCHVSIAKGLLVLTFAVGAFLSYAAVRRLEAVGRPVAMLPSDDVRTDVLQTRILLLMGMLLLSLLTLSNNFVVGCW